MIFNLSGLQQFLADNGIFATVYDSYMDHSIPHGTIVIETVVDENTVMSVIGNCIPMGVDIIVRNPDPHPDSYRYMINYDWIEPKSCICFGPPAKDCPVHGSNHG